MFMYLRALIISLLLVSTSYALDCEDDYTIVVNAKNKVSTLTSNELRQIYLGQKKYWDDGERIIIFRLTDEKCLTKKFLNEVVGQDLPQYLSHWRRKLFSGRALPPKVIETSDKIIEEVMQEPGSIGFLDKNSYKNNSNIKSINLTN